MKRGRKFTIHGAYGSKAKAERSKPKGSFIVKRRMRGGVRYVVLKPRRER